tara:strand:- start:1475 stop:1747 length:273 start_codon:yes stop_codon:yes gene_type:complete
MIKMPKLENYPIKSGLYYFDNEDEAFDFLNLYFEDNKIKIDKYGQPLTGRMNSMEDINQNEKYTIVYWRKNGVMKIQVGFPNSSIKGLKD